MMDASPTLSAITRRTSEPGTLRVTLGSLEGNKDQSSSVFSGFAGLLAVLLLVTAFCILWNWNKRKKRQVPYLQVNVMPSLTLPRPRQRAKNIYDLLPRQQEEMGSHQSRSSRAFSTESLLSRNSDNPERALSQADDTSQRHRAHIHTVGYTVGIYDNATVPQMGGHLAPSAHYISGSTSRDSSSISSVESNDYVNVPTVEGLAETLNSTNGPPKNLFVLPRARELTEERPAVCEDASDCTSFWVPGTQGSDPLSDEEDSPQTSNDYINVTGLELGDIQEEQPRVAFQGCRDYENIPPANPNGSQQQAEEEVTSSNTEDRTDGSVTQISSVTRKSLSSGYYMAFQPSIQNENSQMSHEEEMSDEDSNDYENVLVAELGEGDREQEPGTWCPPDEQISRYPAGTPHGVLYPAEFLANTESKEGP
ncbi:lymphocyte transmembrane adapter 1 [Castor canadensis]|uniref:Lymphocyte transmembrane adapter 1 n=2 Tax=Castor canadensis TaxID=51338 RepID=A0A8B7VI58_CASCN